MMIERLDPDRLREEAMIADFLVRNGGPSTAPNWGDLQPLYDRLVERGHSLIRLLDAPGSMGAVYELDGELVTIATVIALARKVGVPCTKEELKAPRRRRKKAKVKVASPSLRGRSAENLYNVLFELADRGEERPSRFALRVLAGFNSLSAMDRALHKLQDDGRIRIGRGAGRFWGQIEICATGARTRARHG